MCMPKWNWTLEGTDSCYIGHGKFLFIPELFCHGFICGFSFCWLQRGFGVGGIILWPWWSRGISHAHQDNKHSSAVSEAWAGKVRVWSWPWSDACMCSCRPYSGAAGRDGSVRREDAGYIRAWAGEALTHSLVGFRAKRAIHFGLMVKSAGPIYS